MATKDWSELKGKAYRVSVGKTSDEAVAASDSEYIFFTTDGNIVLNGTKFIPTPQSGTKGNISNYVYSDENNAQNDVLCGVFKVFQNGTELKLCHKIWGSGNNKYDDGKYHTVDFPHVTTSSAGVFEAPMLVRLRNTTLKEVNSTTQAVNITYPNYKDGSTQVLTLSAATTAKAGVMTASHVNSLNDLTKHYKDLGTFQTESEALEKLLTIGVCADKDLLHAHLKYKTTDEGECTMILVQHIEGKWCRQVLFNKTKIFQRTIYFTDTNRTAVDWNENWNFMFCDRLTWDAANRKYIPNQFGNIFNQENTDAIPLATKSNAGLMSAADKALLEEIKNKLSSA